MRKIFFTVAAVLLAGILPSGMASTSLAQGQSPMGTYTDVRSRQAVGRVEVASDGRFFLYEWGRPYLGWAPQTTGIVPAVANRLQTFLFRVDMQDSKPTSQYLFYPNAGCTYWLGAISPDNKRVIVYELDLDDRRLRVGAVNLEEKDESKKGQTVQWFTPRPDEARLAERTGWISNEEFTYPVAGEKAPFMRASILKHEAQPCVSCSAATMGTLKSKLVSEDIYARTVAHQSDSSGLPAAAELAAKAGDGALAVYVAEDNESISLFAKQPGFPARTIFENIRSDTATPVHSSSQGNIGGLMNEKGEAPLGEKGRRPWQLQDTIDFRCPSVDLDNLFSRSPSITARGPILGSPDGEYFFFLLKGGDLAEDVPMMELKLYRTRDVLQWLDRLGPVEPPPPMQSVVFRSRNGAVEPLDTPMWDVDGSSITFAAALDGETHRDAYRLHLDSGELERLSHGRSLLDRIPWVVARGEGSLHYEIREGRPVAPRYPVEAVERHADGSFTQGWESRSQSTERLLVATYRGTAHEVRLPVPLRGYVPNTDVTFSRDGSLAFMRLPAPGAAGQSAFVRIDVRDGSATLLSVTEGQPSATYPGTQLPIPPFGIYWSQDGKRAIFVNTRMAQAGSSAEAPPAIAEYDLVSGDWKQLETLNEAVGSVSRQVSAVGWLKPGQELLVMREINGIKAEGTIYAFTDSGVTSRIADASQSPARAAPLQLSGGLKMRLAQSANEPPQVLASNGKRELPLLDINPQLRSVHLQRTEEFHWRERDGREVAGGLTLPPGFKKGDSTLPLVIQAYIHSPELFLQDGYSVSTDAPQVLAARGFAVLQLEIPVVEHIIVNEGPIFVQRIDAAVAALVEQGIVDPKRIGCTGFSHAGYTVLYSVTHPGRMPLAAAMTSDSFTGSYNEILDFSFYSGARASESTSEIYGGSFWKRKAKWLEDETTFNVDKAVTPLLLTAHFTDPRLSMQVRTEAQAARAVLGAFVANDKPVEYLYFGYSGHQLTRPRERLASLEAMVDWMSFWLQGYEDPSPQKYTQYQRWRPMRAQQEKSLMVAAAIPKGKWVFLPESDAHKVETDKTAEQKK